MNRKLLLSVMALATFVTGLKAQRHELGVRFGLSNLVGDIGKTNYILQEPSSNLSDMGLPAYGGLMYRFNFNPYQTVRLDLGYNHIQFDDRTAKEEYRQNRKMWGTNSLFDASLVFEYNFLPVNNEQMSMLSPYIFAGVGGMLADVTQANLINDFRRDADGVAQAPLNDQDFETHVEYDTKKQFVAYVPFGVGLKYKFNRNWAISAEVMFRLTNSDKLDYSRITSKDIKMSYNSDILDPSTNLSLLQSDPYFDVAQERQQEFYNKRNVGDLNSKDWVNSVTLGVSYSFGRPPCYCD